MFAYVSNEGLEKPIVKVPSKHYNYANYNCLGFHSETIMYIPSMPLKNELINFKLLYMKIWKY